VDTMLLFLRLIVAVVFVLAGVGKLFDLPGSVLAAEGFGVPQRFSRFVGYTLPIAEIAIAIGLVSVATAPIAAAAGTALMLAFIVVISITLARGERPDCHCFGALHSAPIGWQTLVRNGLIALGAGLVFVAGPGTGLIAWLRDLDTTSLVLLSLLLASVVAIAWQWMTVGHLTQTATAMANRISAIEGILNGDSPQDVPGPEVGAAAPGFLLKSIGKGMVTLESLKALGKPVVLVFAEPTCSVCNMVMPKIARWKQDLADSVTVAVISSGTEEANRRKVDRYGIDWVLLQETREVTMAYRTPGTPSAVLIDRNGVVATPLTFGPDAILGMFAQIAEAARETNSHAPMPAASRETPRHSTPAVATASGAR
jgi:methylamine dehydrogenase accessory protein MauD